ncbi:MAG: ATP phosphoribosyltransferase [Actinobacteria bacterium RBG_13_35_12]|jgi:ATP phosphoribosyltransferase|nr:MAG: ATP phosphoribosyltransferase [Actinobacteria bacterium RBG_13_35_12]
MKNEIKVAVPKGYLFDQCVDILKKAGYKVEDLMEKNRKLSIYSVEDSIQYVISRPMDIPVYVEHGACDVGFSGKDALMEKESNVYELLDLKSGKCRIILATLKDCTERVKEHYRHFGSVKVATSYPNIAKKYFDQKGIQAEIIKLHGSVELAPILGIADEILDITSTGKTLKENDLVEIEEVFVSTTRLIANITSYRVKYDLISKFINNIKSVIK